MENSKIILASSNKHKLEEIKSILNPLGYTIISLDDIGYTKDIIEDGNTFSENSYIKAKTIYDEYHLPVIADDSGLSVECLNGAPGVHSHRYSGENATDKLNREKLISVLRPLNLDRYNAFFTTAITYIDSKRTFTVEGKLYGEIILDERGNNGFGYDPIFYIRERGLTTAELSMDEKNAISHRHNALIKLVEELKKCV